jgi:hypothetical protein
VKLGAVELVLDNYYLDVVSRCRRYWVENPDPSSIVQQAVSIIAKAVARLYREEREQH